MKRSVALLNAGYGPGRATAMWTDATAARICIMSAMVKELGLYKVSWWDFGVEADGTDIDGLEYRLECVTLNVTEDRFFWSGYVKHTDERFETEGIPVSELAVKT